MKKFNIASNLDISTLHREIYDYPESDFYIFMSPDTADRLMEIEMILNDHMVKPMCSENGNEKIEMIGTYWGHKLFRDPTMKYGDIKFR